ncbi:MAG: GNAT family N-acetyltransferase [Sphingopyxis sp.]|uniref:GNAT family N-acetyltransferase n=1 Tax=Sphingopyxis sp. TaxID=1908224 RepID=UPI002AB9B572|nr:GNAT family N-acetyltransferase [Sphingopyxis sp.]MDZ3832565.1 GNAT family N-acetyltransferase [Sphingopyxis sp.]
MTITRPYRPSDKTACLALFDSNVLQFFASSERADFADFLDQKEIEQCYLVLVDGARIVGCGGHMTTGDGQSAMLCWGMVDRTRHGSGLGTSLVEARLDAIFRVPGVHRVLIDTSQHSQGFYARLGFRVVKITLDGYAPGLDRWDMMLSALHRA